MRNLRRGKIARQHDTGTNLGNNIGAPGREGGGDKGSKGMEKESEEMEGRVCEYANGVVSGDGLHNGRYRV